MFEILSLIWMYILQMAEWVAFSRHTSDQVDKMLDICFIVWASSNSTWVYNQHLEESVPCEDLEHRDAIQVSTERSLPPSLNRAPNWRHVPVPTVGKLWSESWRPPQFGVHLGTCENGGWIRQSWRPQSWPTPAVPKAKGLSVRRKSGSLRMGQRHFGFH